MQKLVGIIPQKINVFGSQSLMLQRYSTNALLLSPLQARRYFPIRGTDNAFSYSSYFIKKKTQKYLLYKIKFTIFVP